MDRDDSRDYAEQVRGALLALMRGLPDGYGPEQGRLIGDALAHMEGAALALAGYIDMRNAMGRRVGTAGPDRRHCPGCGAKPGQDHSRGCGRPDMVTGE